MMLNLIGSLLLLSVTTAPEAGQETGAAAGQPGNTQNTVTLMTSEPVRTVFIEHKGPYWTLGNRLNEVRTYMARNKINGRIFVAYASDPLTTGPDKLEMKIGFVDTGQHDPQPPFRRAEIAPRSVARISGQPSIRLAQACRDLQAWAVEAGYERNGPIIEYFDPQAGQHRNAGTYEMAVRKYTPPPPPEPAPTAVADRRPTTREPEPDPDRTVRRTLTWNDPTQDESRSAESTSAPENATISQPAAPNDNRTDNDVWPPRPTLPAQDNRTAEDAHRSPNDERTTEPRTEQAPGRITERRPDPQHDRLPDRRTDSPPARLPDGFVPPPDGMGDSRIDPDTALDPHTTQDPHTAQAPAEPSPGAPQPDQQVSIQTRSGVTVTGGISVDNAKLYAEGPYPRLARRLLPDANRISPNTQTWLGQIKFRLSAIRKGLRRFNQPGSEGAIALIDAVTDRYDAIAPGFSGDPLGSSVVAADPANPGAARTQRTLMHDLDQLLGNVAAGRISPAETENALMRFLASAVDLVESELSSGG